MKTFRKSTFVRVILFLVLITIVYLGFWLWNSQLNSQNYLLSNPIEKNSRIYDKAVILDDIKESTERYLEILEKEYAIEAVIATLPALPQNHSIGSLSAELFSNWQIGKVTGGRGLLLLLVDNEKLVKIEVAYELEDVFTDIFCGYIEDKQLKPYFLSDQVEIGLVAVLEEIERRAQIKHQAKFTVAEIKQLDQELLSGGAGAKRQLNKYQPETITSVGTVYPAGRDPDEAWQTLIRSWKNKVRDPNLEVYTEMTKMAYREFQNLPDSRYEEDALTYGTKPYKVIQNDTYAVIYFGKKKGWENAPFLFCRTPEGWQFDIVHQRKYVRMGKSPHWGIERSEYPYVELLSGCPYWMNQDIPLEDDDIYRIDEDYKLAQKIRSLELAFKKNPQDFQGALQLGRLYTITSLSPKKRITMLKKAKQLNPDSALPYKYLAIVYHDGFYQFESAIKEIAVYIEQHPDSVFGHNFLGYLYYCTKRYKDAIGEFEKAIQLQPDNCYAYAKMSRTFAHLFLNASKVDPRRPGYKDLAVEMFTRSSTVDTPIKMRINWLESFLTRKKILN